MHIMAVSEEGNTWEAVMRKKTPEAPQPGYMAVMRPATLAVMQQYLTASAGCTDAWLKPFSSALVNWNRQNFWLQPDLRTTPLAVAELSWPVESTAVLQPCLELTEMQEDAAQWHKCCLRLNEMEMLQ